MVSALVVLPFLMAVGQGAGQHFFVTDKPLPALVEETVQEFSARLKVPVPAIETTSQPNAGWVFCSSEGCEIHIGVRFDRDLASAEAKRAVLAHELGHVLQAANGESFYHLSDSLLFFVVTAIVVLYTGWRWWVASAIGLSAIVWGSFFAGVSYSDNMIFNVLIGTFASFLIWIFRAIIFRKNITPAALALVATMLIFITWAQFRVFDDHQKSLESNADLISACLVGSESSKLFLKTLAKYEGTGLLAEIHHPPSDTRIAAVDAFDARNCGALLSHKKRDLVTKAKNNVMQL